LAILDRLAAIDSLGTHPYDGPLAGRFFLLARVAPARAQLRVRLLRWWPWRYPNEDNPTRAPTVAARTTPRSPSSFKRVPSAATRCLRTWCAPNAATTWGARWWRRKRRSLGSGQ